MTTREPFAERQFRDALGIEGLTETYREGGSADDGAVCPREHRSGGVPVAA